MEVWISEWTCPGNSDLYTTLWHTEQHALQYTASTIILTIADWNLSDSETRIVAQQINDAIAIKQYDLAISIFNDYQNEVAFEFQEFFLVSKRAVATQPPDVSLIDFSGSVKDNIIPSVNLSIDCPCGLLRSTCDYHKP